jgi:hypothetical protein
VSAPFLAKVTLTAIAAGQGLAPLFIDLNRTHATHPQWTGHARFHVVWQTFAATLSAAVTLALIWWSGHAENQRFYLAAVLTAIPLAGFLIALWSRPLYGGTLHDPHGIPPLRIRTRAGVVELDLNAAIVTLAVILLTGAVILY